MLVAACVAVQAELWRSNEANEIRIVRDWHDASKSVYCEQYASAMGTRRFLFTDHIEKDPRQVSILLNQLGGPFPTRAGSTSKSFISPTGAGTGRRMLMQSSADVFVKHLGNSPSTHISQCPWRDRWGQLLQLHLDVETRQLPYFVEDARGWPLPCVWCCLDLNAAGRGVAIGGIVIPGQASPNDLTTLRVLPYRPIWWGLLGNTLVYAAAWMLLVFGFTVPRRWLRLRRGFCGNCAYDLRSLPVTIERCPECGTSRHNTGGIPTPIAPMQQGQNNPGP